MRGQYRFFRDGKLVGQFDNLITTAGKKAIIRYLAGEIGGWAGAIAVGSSDTAAVVGDEKLGFEWGRGEVNLLVSEIDEGTINDSLVVARAVIPLNEAGWIHEVGVYSQFSNLETQSSGQVLATFDTTVENPDGGTNDTTNFRIGTMSQSLTTPLSTTDSIVYPNYHIDLSGYQDTDSFSLAYYRQDANATAIAVRMKKDASNYFEYSFAPAGTNGYHIKDWNLDDFTETGDLGWDEIAEMEFRVTVGAGGSNTTVFDGFRINDTDDYDEYVLVSRAVVTAQLKDNTSDLEIEYSIGPNF